MKNEMKKTAGKLKGFLVLAGILLLWAAATEFGWVGPAYLPHPWEVATAFHPALIEGIAATLLRTITGFLIGMGLAYLLHFLAVVTRTIDFWDVQFAASRAVPSIAFMPLFLLWFGFGEEGRIAIVALTAVFIFLAPLQGAFQTLPREWTILGDRADMPNWRYYLNIVVPGTAGMLLGAYRLTLAICFTIAIAGDYMGAESGIGTFIDSARVTFNIPGIFLAIICAAVIGILLDRIILFVYNRLVHWGGKTMKA